MTLGGGASRPSRAGALAGVVFAASLFVPGAARAQTAPGEFQIAPRGYVQVDWRGFPDWTVTPGAGRLSRATLEVRRLRLGVDGRWRWLEYEATIDPQDNDGVFARDVYGQVRLPGAIRLRVGQFKVPGSAEYGESARTLDMMERAAFAMTIAPGRDIGAMVSRDVGQAWAVEAGVFAGDGNGRDSRAGLTAAAHLAWKPVRDLDVGVAVSQGETRARDEDAPNGLVGRSTVWYRFFDRLYVQGRRARIGSDVRWSPGPWRITAEVMRAADERSAQGLDGENLPGVVAHGWSAAVRRQLGRRAGAARTRWREMDVMLRLDGLSFDDSAPPTGRDSVRPRATDVRAKGVTTATLGVSWVPARWARVLTNVGVERYSERRSAPEAGRRDYWTAGTRLQIELP